jgi:hypothetical protein
MLCELSPLPVQEDQGYSIAISSTLALFSMTSEGGQPILFTTRRQVQNTAGKPECRLRLPGLLNAIPVPA